MSFKEKLIAKKRFICSFALILSALGVLCLYMVTKDELRFNRLSERLFLSELEGNTLSLHYTLAYPENYGFEGKAVLPCYTGRNMNTLSENEVSSEEEETLHILSALSRISKDRLPSEDAYTYDLLVRYLCLRLSGLEFDYYSEPFSPDSGIQSGLPILLADYTFRRKQDVEDYLSLLDQTDEYLSGLLLYEEEKAQAGLFMADYSAAKVIEQCTVIMDKEQLKEGTHFLHTTFEERMNELTEQGLLSDEEARQYLSENDRLLTTVMAPAYEQIADTFTLLSGSGRNEYGLYYFPEGREYYEYLLASATGSSRSITEIKRLLFEDFRKNYDDMLQLISKYPEITNPEFTASLDLPLSSPSQMLQDLQSRMSEDFPPFPSQDGNFQTTVNIKAVSPSMEDYSSPAYYLIPPVDDMKNNTIYINRKNAPDNLTLYTTLAHEGYPGHLYQTVYSQLCLNRNSSPDLRCLIRYGGFVEGWAYYVENLSYFYAEDMVKENAYAAAYYESCRLSRNIHLALYSLIDIAIHYDGATPMQVQEILQSIGVTDLSSVAAIYRYIAEEPVNYLKYYLGYLEIELLKEEAGKLWGEDFTPYRFHTFLLETGPSDFTGLSELLRSQEIFPVILKE